MLSEIAALKTMNINELNGLFYPQTVCLFENVLKNFLLIFDHLYFLPNDIRLNPGFGNSIRTRCSINDAMLDYAFLNEEEFKYSIAYLSDEKAWPDKLKKLMDFYDDLEAKDVCRILKDEDFEDIHKWHPFKECIDADMKDSRFKTIASSNIKIYDISKFKKPEASFKGGGFAMRPYRSNDLFTEISSERINSTLYFAEIYNLIPITNINKFNSLMRQKMRRSILSTEYRENNPISNLLI